jgi:hypothetical protein
MRKLFFFLLVPVCLLGSVSCNKNFEAVNTNPNNPEAINPELLMVTITTSVVNSMTNDAFTPGNIVAQYESEIREPSVDRYEWTGSFDVWSNGYATLANVQNLYELDTAADQSNYRGIALIFKALIFARMTDCYGDLPFSQALQATAATPIYSPKYDRQQDIYPQLIAELDTANTLLNANGGYIRNDILYNDNYLQWKKFANTLRMRLLLRESNKVNPSAEMQKMLNDPTDYPLFGSNTDNAALTYSSAPNLSPVTQQPSGDFMDNTMSRTLVDTLNEFGDPRLQAFATPTTASVAAGNPQYVGVFNGAPDDTLGIDTNSVVSFVGTLYYNGLNVPVLSQGLIMTYSDLQFILAEAAQRGWITGNAQTYYEAGIQASIQYYSQVSQTPFTMPAGYLSQPGVAYNPANGLALIGTQRWIALYFEDMQGWQEWKRTGYPALKPSVTNYNNNVIPVRFLYPTDQQVTNLNNYDSAIAIQGPDNLNTKIWWMN